MAQPPVPTLFLALDLEFNQPSGALIQVGAVLGDLDSGQVRARFCELVNPGEPLEPRIAKLCGIDAGALAAAEPLESVFEAFETWLGQFGDARHLNPLTWGGSDAHTLCERAGKPTDMFGRRWLDVKTMFTAYCMAQGGAGVGGLANAMKHVGLRFQGKKHNAADDAANTFLMFRRLLELMRRPA